MAQAELQPRFDPNNPFAGYQPGAQLSPDQMQFLQQLRQSELYAPPTSEGANSTPPETTVYTIQTAQGPFSFGIKGGLAGQPFHLTAHRNLGAAENLNGETIYQYDQAGKMVQSGTAKNMNTGGFMAGPYGVMVPLAIAGGAAALAGSAAAGGTAGAAGGAGGAGGAAGAGAVGGAAPSITGLAGSGMIPAGTGFGSGVTLGEGLGAFGGLGAGAGYGATFEGAMAGLGAAGAAGGTSVLGAAGSGVTPPTGGEAGGGGVPPPPNPFASGGSGLLGGAGGFDWGSLIGPALSGLGGIVGAGATSDAADAQLQAAREAAALQEPFRQMGLTAGGRAMDLLGLSNNKLAAGYGSLAGDFTPADFLRGKDPGYNFLQQEGERGMQRAASLSGGVGSGKYLKDAMRFNQGLASREYGKAFDRFQVNRTNRLNPLLSLTGAGQVASNTIGDYTTQGGNATAAGKVGGANAFTNALGQGFSMYQNQQQQNQNNALMQYVLRRGD
jgi:hypothetical protein